MARCHRERQCISLLTRPRDGVFGRCQRFPVIDVFKYEVLPPVVQRLRIVLQKLSQRGLTWKDEYTQRIIANELSTIRKLYNRQPEALPPDGLDTSRRLQLQSDPEGNYELEKNKNFARSFHQYLQSLGILPQLAPPNFYPRTKTKPTPVMNDKIDSDRLIDRVLQKSQGNSPALSFASVPQQKASENLPSKTLPQFPKESKMDHDKKSLLAALKAYLARKAPAQTPDNINSNPRAKAPPLFSNRYYNPQLSQTDGVLPEDDGGGSFNTKPFLQRPRNRKISRPNTGALFYKSSSRHLDPKDPLSAVDETFIQNVVKELGRRKLNIDILKPKELDELAAVIADTLQIVDGDQLDTRKPEWDREEHEMKRVEQYESQEIGDESKELNTSLQGLETDGKESRSETKAKETSSSKEYVADFTVNPIAQEFMIEEPFKSDVKNYGDFHYMSDDDGEEKVGMEDVKSETYVRELTAQKKAVQDTDSKELLELQHWMSESLTQDGRSYSEEPRKKVTENLEFQVKSSSNDQYGYIVTQKNHLTAEKGVELLKEVSALLKQQMTAFNDISVSGSTVIFQVRANVINMTNEDVVVTAGRIQTKTFLFSIYCFIFCQS
uniref:Receptor-type tyrosine-protein phosphatase N2 n=1 Tax=Leptobrachium leishanense TaxID=445787 RepID=A0A8C5PZW9_9ANUR